MSSTNTSSDRPDPTLAVLHSIVHDIESADDHVAYCEHQIVRLEKEIADFREKRAQSAAQAVATRQILGRLGYVAVTDEKRVAAQIVAPRTAPLTLAPIGDPA